MNTARNLKTTWVIGVVLLAVTAISGCAGSTSSTGGAVAKPPALPDISRSEPPIPPLAVPVSVDPSQLVSFHGGGAYIRPDGSMTLPLDRFNAQANDAVIEQAISQLGQKCMYNRGLATPSAFLHHSGPQPPAPFILYGVIDLNDAKRYGYRDPTSFGKPATPPRASEAVTPALVQAYFGDPRTGQGGCRSEAQGKLGGDAEMALYTLLQDLRSEALSAAHMDGRVKSVTAKWSACMRKAGLDYADPSGPAHDRGLLGRGLPTPQGASLPPPSPAEIAAAVTDVSCKLRTWYLQTIAEVSAAYQLEIIAKQTPALQEAVRGEKREFSTALQVLQNSAAR